MKEITYSGCQHKEMVDESVSSMGFCSRCLAVSSPDELFVGYATTYTTQYGKGVMVAIKSIDDVSIVVETNHATGIAYREWSVQKSDFHKKGLLFVADPFGKVK